MTKRRLHPSIAFLVLVLAAALAFPTMAFASQAAAAPGADAAGSPRPACPATHAGHFSTTPATTYASLVAMTNPTTGLPADRMSAAGVQGVETSTTNIGGYMWSTIVAEQLEHHQPRRGRRAPRPHAPFARDDGAPPAGRSVLQLVRPQHSRRRSRSAGRRGFRRSTTAGSRPG